RVARAGACRLGISLSGADDPEVRCLARHQAAVDIEVFLHHPAGGEALLEPATYALPGDLADASDRRHGAGLVLDDISGDPILDHLGHGTCVEADDWRAAGHRLDHHESERLRPVDR